MTSKSGAVANHAAADLSGVLADAILENLKALFLGGFAGVIRQICSRGTRAGAVDKAEGGIKTHYLQSVSWWQRSHPRSHSGNPIIKSEEILISGRTARRRRILDLYSMAVWPRFMAIRIRSEPLCTGRCRWLTSSGTRS